MTLTILTTLQLSASVLRAPSQVFQDAIQSPEPAFRYFTSEAVSPLAELKVSEPDGSRYIRTVSKAIFSAGEN